MVKIRVNPSTFGTNNSASGEERTKDGKEFSTNPDVKTGFESGQADFKAMAPADESNHAVTGFRCFRASARTPDNYGRRYKSISVGTLHSTAVAL